MKIHLGCWHRNIPGFVHIDYCDYPHIDYKSNIQDLHFLNDNSAELIYCSHALEYFDRAQAEQALKEWYRVLQPGGTLRLAVPDFEKYIWLYNSTGNIDLLMGALYGKMSINDGSQTLYHRAVYDKKSLTKMLETTGFKNVQYWDWRKTEHATVDDFSQAYYPHMEKDTGTLMSLNLEAYKE